MSYRYNSSPDDGPMAARNMYRIEININEKLCVKLVIYKDCTEMNGQQNIKYDTHCPPITKITAVLYIFVDISFIKFNANPTKHTENMRKISFTRFDEVWPSCTDCSEAEEWSTALRVDPLYLTF